MGTSHHVLKRKDKRKERKVAGPIWVVLKGG